MESGRSIEEIQHAQLREARSIWAPPIAGRGGVRMSGFLGYVRTVDDLLTVDPWDLRLGLRLRIPLFCHVHVAAAPHLSFALSLLRALREHAVAVIRRQLRRHHSASLRPRCVLLNRP